MTETSLSSRHNSDPAVAPARVGEAIIKQCNKMVEPAIKRRIRALLLPWLRKRLRVAELGEGFQWGSPLCIATGSRIGRYVYLGADFECAGTVSVGDLCMISSGCKIVGADHLYNVVGTPTRLAFAAGHRTTTIGADVWIGMRVTILEGVTIGDGAVVGSGAVVTRDVPPFTVVAGVPARTIRQRFTEDELTMHRSLIHGNES